MIRTTSQEIQNLIKDKHNETNHLKTARKGKQKLQQYNFRTHPTLFPMRMLSISTGGRRNCHLCSLLTTWRLDNFCCNFGRKFATPITFICAFHSNRIRSLQDKILTERNFLFVSPVMNEEINKCNAEFIVLSRCYCLP